MAESAKAKAAVQLLTKRTAKAGEARFESSFRRSVSISTCVGVESESEVYSIEVLLGRCRLVQGGYSWTLLYPPTFYLLLTVRRSNASTSTSHRFDSELNGLAAGMGCKGGKGGRDGPVLGQTVQARLPPYF